MSRRSLRCSPRAGLTLLEVIAGIAILSTILVLAVVSRSRQARQLALSQRIDRAVTAADELIADWYVDPAPMPLGQSGPVEGQEGMAWRIFAVSNDRVEQLGARVVRVQVLQERSSHGIEAGEVLTEVDLVLPSAQPEPQSRQEHAP